LSFYDSLYLDLAKERSAALATLDGVLARAATAEGLSLL
jgi:predicted nucleic acid-binding protein